MRIFQLPYFPCELVTNGHNSAAPSKLDGQRLENNVEGLFTFLKKNMRRMSVELSINRTVIAKIVLSLKV